MLKLKNKIREAENQIMAEIDHWHSQVDQFKKFMEDFKYIALVASAFMIGVKLASKRPISFSYIGSLVAKAMQTFLLLK